MSRSNLFLLAIALAIFGTAVIAGHPNWGTFTGLATLLLAGATAAGALPLGSEPDFAVQSVPHQKISNSLVTLSSAAVLAVYIAGYHRTGSAADGFAAQAARRRTAAPIVASAVAPKTATPRVEATPAVRPTSAQPFRKVSPRASSAPVLNAAPTPAASEDSPGTPSASPAASTSNDQVAVAAAPIAAAPQGRYKDGRYLGWGTSRHGDIQASLVIQGGTIVSSEIAQCLTRYSCSWIAALPGQVISRQSPNVDYVSGATQSCNAFSDAVAQALSQASE
jgi:uncharacterized protein with FMN-binding domain